MKLDVYLNYRGNCEGAFRFYEQNLGGKMTVRGRARGHRSRNTRLARRPVSWQALRLMEGRVRVRASMVALTVILFVVGGRHAAGQDWSASARAEASADRLAILTLDTLAGQLAVLEVNRPALLTRYVPEAEAVRLLDRQRQALCEALDGLPQGPARAHEYAAARMVGAIVEKLAGLSVDRALRSVDRDPTHSDMKDLEAVIAALARRRDELIALHSGRVCPAGAPQRR